MEEAGMHPPFVWPDENRALPKAYTQMRWHADHLADWRFAREDEISSNWLHPAGPSSVGLLAYGLACLDN